MQQKLLFLLHIVQTSLAASAATVTVPSGDRSDHNYYAYQIFTGTQSDDKGALGNPAWGSGINATGFLAALRNSEVPAVANAFVDNTITVDTPAKVVEKLGTFTTDSAEAKEIAKLAYANIKDNVGIQLKTGENTEVVSGYYLIVDKTENMEAGDAYNTALLQVTSNITIKDKTDAPGIEKKILDKKNDNDAQNDKWEDTNNAAVGETVTYKLTSHVPDMENFDKYYFIMHDHLSKGLSYGTEGSVNYGSIQSITIGEGNDKKVLTAGSVDATDATKVVNGDYAVVVTKATDGTDIKIIFNDFIQYKNKKGALVEVQYTATVNKDAIIGVEGNPNNVYLEYSNNPNEEGTGEDTPGGNDDVTGETPKDWVETYVTELVIKKVDGEGNVVTGAEFTLKGSQVNKAKVTREVFTKDASGTYYKLNDGTYTITAPVDETADKYEKEDNKYVMYTKSTETKWVGTGETQTAVKATVGDDGVLKFTGLSAGTYTLKETVTPAGYNTAEDRTIVITCTEDETFVVADDTNCTWKYDDGDSNEYKVVNLKGATLPETGGIGTTIFYVLGAILAIGAGLLLITKKRMSAER